MYICIYVDIYISCGASKRSHSRPEIKEICGASERSHRQTDALFENGSWWDPHHGCWIPHCRGSRPRMRSWGNGGGRGVSDGLWAFVCPRILGSDIIMLDDRLHKVRRLSLSCLLLMFAFSLVPSCGSQVLVVALLSPCLLPAVLLHGFLGCAGR